MKPPRHADHFLMGSLRDIQRDPLGFLTSLHRIGPLDYYLAVHPDGIKRILQDNHPNYTKRVPDVQTVGRLTDEWDADGAGGECESDGDVADGEDCDEYVVFARSESAGGRCDGGVSEIKTLLLAGV